MYYVYTYIGMWRRDTEVRSKPKTIHVNTQSTVGALRQKTNCDENIGSCGELENMVNCKGCTRQRGQKYQK